MYLSLVREYVGIRKNHPTSHRKPTESRASVGHSGGAVVSVLPDCEASLRVLDVLERIHQEGEAGHRRGTTAEAGREARLSAG